MLARWCRRGPSMSSRGCRSVWGEAAAPLLKNWQEDAIQACINAIRGGQTRVGLQILGLDKTSTFTAVADRIPPPHREAKKIMLIAISEKRLEKISGALARQREGAVAAKLGAPVPKRKERPPISDVRTVTWVTFRRQRSTSIRFDNLKAIIVYDAHRAPPELFNFLASRFDSEQSSTSYIPPIIGTCSVDDLNALPRTGFFKQVAYRRTTLDYFKEAWEVPVRFLAVPARISIRDMKAVKNTAHYHRPVLAKKMCQPDVLRLTTEAWLQNAATRKSTLVYAVDHRHAEKLVAEFQKVNIDAVWVYSFSVNTIQGSPERLANGPAFDKFKAGDSPVLVVPADLDAEVRVPRIDCVLMAAPVLRQYDLEKRLLPGMKASPHTLKEDTLVIDVVDSVSKRSDYNICDLFQLQAADIDGQPLDVLERRAEEKARMELEAAPPLEPTLQSPPHKKTVLVKQRPISPTLARLEQEEETDATLKALAAFFSIMKWRQSPGKRWIRCGKGIYVSDFYAHGHAILRESEARGLFEVYWTTRPLDAQEDVDDAGMIRLSAPGKLVDVIPKLKAHLVRQGDEMKTTRRYMESKATPAQLDALRDFCPDQMPHILYDGKPMETDAFLEWLTVKEASTALALCRYSPEIDVEPFSFRAQTYIVAWIKAGITLWDAREEKDAREAAAHARKEDAKKLVLKAKLERRRAKSLEKQQLLEDLREYRRRQKEMMKQKEEVENAATNAIAQALAKAREVDKQHSRHSTLGG